MSGARPSILSYIITILVGALLFIPFLGAVPLFDWDEINFAESAREMIVTGNYQLVQINFQPFWEKPPLFFWLQVASMKLFGINEFAARFPNALFGILTLCTILYIGKRHFRGELSVWWILCYIGSFTPHFYFKSGIIDPVFNYFIFVGIYQLFLAYLSWNENFNNTKHFLYAAIFTGLAILTKGPVALLVTMLTIGAFVVYRRMEFFFSLKEIFVYFFTVLLVTSVWFLPEVFNNGIQSLLTFVEYQIGLFSQNVAGHQQPFYYHTIVLLLGCFPASILAFLAYRKDEELNIEEKTLRVWMVVMFWVVLVLFSIVKTKIVHYSSLCWLPLTFMAAYGIEHIRKKRSKVPVILSVLLLLIGLIMGAAIALVPLAGFEQNIRTYIFENVKDEFVIENLKMYAGWQGWEPIIGITFILLILTVFILLFFKKYSFAFPLLFIGTTVTIPIMSISIVPKVEKHTQGAATEFLSSLAGKDVYILHLGYKSYAPYFYGKTKPLSKNDGLRNYLSEAKELTEAPYKDKSLSMLEQTEKSIQIQEQLKLEWLFKGLIDKDAYFITKINSGKTLSNSTGVQYLGSKGGFKFYVRKKSEATAENP